MAAPSIVIARIHLAVAAVKPGWAVVDPRTCRVATSTDSAQVPQSIQILGYVVLARRRGPTCFHRDSPTLVGFLGPLYRIAKISGNINREQSTSSCHCQGNVNARLDDRIARSREARRIIIPSVELDNRESSRRDSYRMSKRPSSRCPPLRRRQGHRRRILFWPR